MEHVCQYWDQKNHILKLLGRAICRVVKPKAFYFELDKCQKSELILCSNACLCFLMRFSSAVYWPSAKPCVFHSFQWKVGKCPNHNTVIFFSSRINWSLCKKDLCRFIFSYCKHSRRRSGMGQRIENVSTSSFMLHDQRTELPCAENIKAHSTLKVQKPMPVTLQKAPKTHEYLVKWCLWKVHMSWVRNRSEQRKLGQTTLSIGPVCTWIWSS